MAWAIICAALFSYFNYIRGRGFIKYDPTPGVEGDEKGSTLNRILACLGFTFASGFAAAMLGYSQSETIWVMGGSAPLWFFSIVFGWGLYFAAFHGRWMPGSKKHTQWITKIGLWLIPFTRVNDLPRNRARGMLCMALRGLAYSLPVFAWIACTATPWALVVWPCMLLQGLIYWLNKYDNERHGTAYPEIASGALWGFLIGICLVLGKVAPVAPLTFPEALSGIVAAVPEDRSKPNADAG